PLTDWLRIRLNFDLYSFLSIFEVERTSTSNQDAKEKCQLVWTTVFF
ncbi:unnamed protein product, partial [Brassica oleracea]